VANDRHRRYADGRHSYDKVIATIGLLRRPTFQDFVWPVVHHRHRQLRGGGV
jgi:hypothetical protein